MDVKWQHEDQWDLNITSNMVWDSFFEGGKSEVFKFDSALSL